MKALRMLESALIVFFYIKSFKYFEGLYALNYIIIHANNKQPMLYLRKGEIRFSSIKIYSVHTKFYKYQAGFPMV